MRFGKKSCHGRNGEKEGAGNVHLDSFSRANCRRVPRAWLSSFCISKIRTRQSGISVRMVGNLVVLSPHLDDAVLSIGGTILRLSRNHRVVVYDFFTLSDHTRSARFRGTLPVTLLRYTEELLASTIVRFTPKFFLLKDVTIRSKKDHFKVGMSLESYLSRNIKRDRPKAIFCPLGVGEHLDHKSVFHALQKLIEAGIVPRHSVMYYEDMPYSSRTS